MRKRRGLAGGLAVFLAGAAALVPGAASARAQDEVPPPPPPPRRGGAVKPGETPQTLAADPTAPGFRGALLGDTTEQVRDASGRERVVSAVGGVSQPIWVKQPGLELRCEGIVIWGDAEKLESALEVKKVPGSADAKAILGPVIHAIYAEGHVFLRRDTHVIEADRVFVDFRTNQAYVVNARVQGVREVRKGVQAPMVMRAAVVRGTAENKYRAENASLSASGWARPQLEFRADSIDVDFTPGKESFETSWWPTVRMDTLFSDSTPILVLPKLGGTAGSTGIQSVEFGNSNRFGTTLGVGFGGKPKNADGTPWGTWQVTPRYRTRRGTGLSAEFAHQDVGSSTLDGKKGFYEFAADYQFDTAHEDHFSERAFDGRLNGTSTNDRGRVHFFWRNYEHAHRLLGAGSRLDAQADWWSDRGYIPEYEPNEAMADPQKETYVSLTTHQGAQGFSALASYRIADEAVALMRTPFDLLTTDYANQTQYLPRLAYHLVNLPVFGTQSGKPFPVNLSVETSLAHVDRRFDEDTADLLAADLAGWRSEDLVRGDVEARVTTPFELGFLQVTPAFGGSIYGVTDANGYANAGTGDADDMAGRSSAFGGIRVGTEFHRNFDASSDLFQLRGLRHVVSTDVAWFNRFHVSDDDRPYEFQQNDLHDRLFEQDVVSWRLRNRLQTKREGEVVDWLDVETRFLWYADETKAPGVSTLGLREDFASPLDRLDFPGEDKYLSQTRDGSAFLQNRARMQLRENLWVMAETDHDFQSNFTESSGVGVRWFYDEKFSVYVGRRTIHADSAVWTVRGDYALSPKWGFSAEFQKDEKNDRGLRTRVGLYRRAREYTIAVEVESERLLDESGFAIALYPHDWIVGEKSDPYSERRRLDFAALRWYR